MHATGNQKFLFYFTTLHRRMNHFIQPWNDSGRVFLYIRCCSEVYCISLHVVCLFVWSWNHITGPSLGVEQTQRSRNDFALCKHPCLAGAIRPSPLRLCRRLPEQPLVGLPLLIRRPRQTSLRNADILSDVLDQCLFRHVIVFRTDMP